MNILLEKSNFNLDSAQLLIDKNYYAPSVHCSYYSCVQKMLHILLNMMGMTDASIKAAQSADMGSHENLINLIYKEISKTKVDYRTFYSGINQLKMLRKDSDYKEVQILYDKGKASYNKAKEIHSILYKAFNV